MDLAIGLGLGLGLGQCQMYTNKIVRDDPNTDKV